MGALNNAATLGNDRRFREWAIAASAYTAREVLMESPDTPDHEKRLALAKMVLANPAFLAERLTWILATTPDIAVAGDSPEAVGEQTVLDLTADLWTSLADLTAAGTEGDPHET